MVKVVPDTSEFMIDGKPGGSPVNALYSKPLAPGQYFEVDVLASESSAFVGVTTRESFAKGWKCRGLFFGGNLSNGSALVRGEFGERLKTGMKIGVLTEIADESVTVTFYQDGRCLGPAFKSKRSSQGELFPVVHTSGEGDRFAIRFPDTAPTVTDRQPKDGGALRPVEGDWALKRLLVGPELEEVDLPSLMSNHPVKLKVEAESTGAFRISFKVANTMWFIAPSEADESLAPFDRLTPPGGLASSRMMPLGGAADVERHLQQNSASIFKWLAKDGTLKIVGQTIEMDFEPLLDDVNSLPATEVELK